MCVVLGLLQYRSPHRMLAIAGVGPEEDFDHEDDDEGHDEESLRRDDRGREASIHASIEEHIFEHLPPQVHKGDNDYMIIVDL